MNLRFVKADMSKTPKKHDWEKALWALRRAYKIYRHSKSPRIKKAILESGKIVKKELEDKQYKIKGI